MTKSCWKVRAEKALGTRPGVTILSDFMPPPPLDRGQSPVGGVPAAGRPAGTVGKGEISVRKSRGEPR